MLLPSTETDGSRWRLVHHAGNIGRAYRRLHRSTIDEARSSEKSECVLSEDLIEVAHQIITVGDGVCDLLNAQAGLFDGAPPASVTAYLRHHTRLKVNWDTGIDQNRADSAPFPGAVLGRDDPEGAPNQTATSDDDIDIALAEHSNAARSDLEKLLHDGPKTSGWVWGWVLLAVGTLVLAGAVLASAADDGDPTNIMVTTPDGVYCGKIGVNDEGVVTVDERVVPPLSSVEFVDSCA